MIPVLTGGRQFRNSSYLPHPAGAFGQPFRVVSGYNASNPPLFHGVRLTTSDGDERWPDSAYLVDQWVNVKKWDVTISWSCNEAGLSTLSNSFTISTGATATISADGTTVSGHTATPANRVDLLMGDVTTSVTWTDTYTDGGGIDYEGHLTIEVDHGAWAYHADLGLWMPGVYVNTYVTALEPPAGDPYEACSTETGDIGTCDAGWVWDEGDVSEEGGNYCWQCVPDNESASIYVETDPDATPTYGTFMGLTHRARKTENDGGLLANISPLTFSMTWVENDRYSTWGTT